MSDCDSVEHDVDMRMLPVIVAHDEILGIPDFHPLHIFQYQLVHVLIAHARQIKGRETKNRMTDILAEPRIHFALRLQTANNSVNGIKHQAVRTDNLCTFFLVEEVCHRTSVILTLLQFRHRKSKYLSALSSLAQSSRFIWAAKEYPSLLATCAVWLRLFFMPHTKKQVKRGGKWLNRVVGTKKVAPQRAIYQYFTPNSTSCHQPSICRCRRRKKWRPARPPYPRLR